MFAGSFGPKWVVLAGSFLPPAVRFAKNVTIVPFQVRKSGTLLMETNWASPANWVMRAEWIMEWYRQFKIGPQRTERELVRFRCGRVRGAVDEIGFLEDRKQGLQNQYDQFLVRNHLMKAFHEFVKFPAIDGWRQFYKSKHWGKLARFLFLVLVGPSRMGKTNLALSLFGIHYTYVCNAQGTTTPYLNGFSKRFHKAILFDEASPECVKQNKQLFQASADGSCIGGSKTNCHLKELFLYQVPIIICANEWLDPTMKEEWDEGDHWIDKNSVVVNITQKVWVDPPEEEQAAQRSVNA